ncbi:hypothetical protein ACFYE2_05765 [Kocuria sp. CPCC 205300]
MTPQRLAEALAVPLILAAAILALFIVGTLTGPAPELSLTVP